MPTYTFRCLQCGYEMDVQRSIKDRNDPMHCRRCQEMTGTEKHKMRRVFGRVNFARSSVKHEARFDPVLGKVVTSAKDFERKLDQMNAEKGTHYVPADPKDVYVNDDGLDATMRAKTDSGEREPRLWL